MNGVTEPGVSLPATPLLSFPVLETAVFLARPNRFLARVWLAGKEIFAFLPDSGRLPDLLIPGRRVHLRRAGRPGRRTAYDLLLVDHDGILVAVDSRLPNLVFARCVRVGLFPGLDGYVAIRGEVNVNGSRLDFLLRGDGIPPLVVEVKSVTLVRGGVALFPDAPTERGRRHVEELRRLRRSGYRALLCFMIMRGDAATCAPHDAEDPDFAAALRAAVADGVEVRALTCLVSTAGVSVGVEVPVWLQE